MTTAYPVVQSMPLASPPYPTVLSRDGRTSATTYPNAFLSLTRMQLTDVATATTSFALTPGGTQLMDNLKVIDISGNGQKVLFLGDAQLAPGTTVSSLGTPPVLYLYDLASRQVTLLSPPTVSGGGRVAEVSEARITPDGSKVVFETDDSLPGQPASTGTYVAYEMNADRTNIRRVADTGLSNRQCSTGFCPAPMPLAVSDDGSVVAFFSRLNLDPADTGLTDLYVRNLTDGSLRWISRIPPGAYFGVRSINGISADGRVVAFTRDEVATSTSAAWIVDADGHTTSIENASFLLAADGNHVVYSVRDGNIVTGFLNSLYVLDLTAGTARLVARRGYGGGSDTGFAPIALNTDASKILYRDINSGYLASLDVTLDPGPAAPGLHWIDGDVNHDGIVRWAVVGDSYISGEGLNPGTIDDAGQPVGYDPGTNGAANHCHRARTSWAVRLAQAYGATGDNLLFAACSGAVASEVISRAQYPDSPFGVAGGEPQAVTLHNFANGGQVDVVLVSIGGNDAGFSDVVKACLTGTTTCQPQRKDLSEVLAHERHALEAIKGAAPGAEVFHVDYPNPVDPPGADCGSVLFLGGFGFHYGVNAQEEANIGAFLAHLNAAGAQADEEAGVHRLDVADAFESAGICTSSGYMNGLSAGVNDHGFTTGTVFWPVAQESFHPTAAGHGRLRTVVAPQLVAQLGTPNPVGTAIADDSPVTDLPQATIDAVLGPDGSGQLQLQYYPVSDQFVVVSTFSLPHRVGTYHVSPDAPLDLTIPVEHPMAPGLHEVQVSDAGTGEELAAATYLIDLPQACSAAGADRDGDLLPDICDSDQTDGPTADADRDGVPNGQDACPTLADADQADANHDGLGDVCDPLTGATPFAGYYAPESADTIAPSVTGTPARAPDHDGWYTSAVTVDWRAADPDPSSGSVADPRPSVASTDGADQTVTSDPACDRAGHCASGSVTLSIDSTPPITTATVPDAPASGWYDGPVRVALHATDAVSDVAETRYSVDGGPPQAYTGPFDFAGDGTHTLRYWSVDHAGNVEDGTAAGHVLTLSVDDVPPAILGTRDPAANAFGWSDRPVSVHFACSDDGSGIAGCVGDETISSETTALGVAAVGNAFDRAGNVGEARVDGIRIDLTRPTLTGTPTQPANASRWYRDDVTIRWSGDDALSGVDDRTLPRDSVLTGEGRNLRAGPETVLDRAGNASDPTASAPVDIDRTPPTISGKPVTDDGAERSPNAQGWFGSAVRVRFACDDALSGVAECPADVVLSDDGADQQTRGTATDAAGNATAATVGDIDIDSHPPTSGVELACGGANGYCRDATATLRFTADDPPSSPDVASAGVQSVSYRIDGTDWRAVAPGTSVEIPLSASGSTAVSFYATDRAGNAESPNTVEVRHDGIAPALSHELLPEPPNAAGWSRADTTVRFSATDELDGSGIDASTLTPDVVVAEETTGLPVSGSVADLAGNTATDAVTVKLDETAPTVAATLDGVEGAHGWYRGAVTATFSCADPGVVHSGLATCSGSQVLADGASAVGQAVDVADNVARTQVGPVHVDPDAPAIRLTGIQDGGEYVLGSVPPASCSATDVGSSGLDGECTVAVTGGLPNGVGTFAFAAVARDLAGNTTTVSGTYRVRYGIVYDAAFWLAPINDTAHTRDATTSVFKAGSTIPAKFRITDASGRPIQANAPPAWVTPIRGGTTSAAVDESLYSAPAMSGSLFAWDAVNRDYQYNWASPRSGAGYYWRLGARLDDGTIQAVNVGLR